MAKGSSASFPPISIFGRSIVFESEICNCLAMVYLLTGGDRCWSLRSPGTAPSEGKHPYLLSIFLSLFWFCGRGSLSRFFLQVRVFKGWGWSVIGHVEAEWWVTWAVAGAKVEGMARGEWSWRPGKIGYPQLPLFAHCCVTTIEQRQKEDQFCPAWPNCCSKMMIFIVTCQVSFVLDVICSITNDGAGYEEKLIKLNSDGEARSKERPIHHTSDARPEKLNLLISDDEARSEKFDLLISDDEARSEEFDHLISDDEARSEKFDLLISDDEARSEKFDLLISDNEARSESLTFSSLTMKQDLKSLTFSSLTMKQDLKSLTFSSLTMKQDLKSLTFSYLTMKQDLKSLTFPSLTMKQDLKSLTFSSLTMKQDLKSLTFSSLTMKQDLKSLTFSSLTMKQDLKKSLIHHSTDG
ncbi:hypothetical protein GQ457_14G018320 [Hibiscus cannabinus]